MSLFDNAARGIVKGDARNGAATTEDLYKIQTAKPKQQESASGLFGTKKLIVSNVQESEAGASEAKPPSVMAPQKNPVISDFLQSQPPQVISAESNVELTNAKPLIETNTLQLSNVLQKPDQVAINYGKLSQTYKLREKNITLPVQPF